MSDKKLFTSELKLRIITALVLLTLFSSVIFKGDALVYLLLTSVVIALSAWEWCGFARINNTLPRLIFVGLVLFCTSILVRFGVEPIWYILACTWWAMGLFWMPFFPHKSRLNFSNRWWVLLNGFFVLVMAWQSIYFWQTERIQLLLLILLVIGSDTGAYFSGKLLGSHKLAPAISPGKTIEGAMGGMLLAILIGVGFMWVTDSFNLLQLLFCALIVVMSILGDLTISAYKRSNQLKDSGSTLPGHGGFLDRIDGLIAAAPLFVLLWGDF